MTGRSLTGSPKRRTAEMTRNRQKTQLLCIRNKPEPPPGWEGRSHCSRLCLSVADRRKAGKASPQLSGLPCRRAKNKGEDGSRAAGLGREGGPGRFGKPRPGVGTACPRKRGGFARGDPSLPCREKYFSTALFAQYRKVCFCRSPSESKERQNHPLRDFFPEMPQKCPAFLCHWHFRRNDRGSVALRCAP